jgi:uncharacterized membrane protein HdeD (DUF308 family)
VTGMQRGEAGVDLDERMVLREASDAWWVFLVTGILWFLVSLVVLRFDLASVSSVGVLLGALFLMAGVNEFLIVGMVDGWRWLHIILGVIFIVGGVWAFVHPIGAFYELASVLGFLLMFKGSLDIVTAIATKPVNELWWLGLVVGLLELLLAFWASQQFIAARAVLILIWVGFMAMFRGVTEIVLAFHLRRMRNVPALAM